MGVKRWQRLTIPTYVTLRPSRTGVALTLTMSFLTSGLTIVARAR
ncbi:MAG TPA: hypothetical protein VFW03_07370 [Gemmatimonadaceae bacterium]|nr:hypothetical protein [Gemmatimonadaceae bacterium]